MEPIGKQLNKYLLPNEPKRAPFSHLPIGAVNILADELTEAYSNPGYRRWYCGVIYDFGPEKILEWRRRASEGKEPARLFSKYVKDARTYRSIKSGLGSGYGA